jgi:DNA polymerase-4
MIFREDLSLAIFDFDLQPEADQPLTETFDFDNNMRTIFHLDLDAFFVSVERIFDPKLKGKPVIVGGDPHGRGVVAACSYEAREFGLHSAMPIRTAFKLCPHGIYLHGHHDEYSNYSRAVKNILEKYAPLIEQASIDEFYMDFTGCRNIYGPVYDFARFVQSEIDRKLSLPCSIGIGTNKNIAKIASDFNKPKGVTLVEPGHEKNFLASLPVERIPGVGKATLQYLQNRGIHTVGDIANLPQELFAAAFGKSGIDLWKKANGLGTEYLSVERDQKSISKESTFGSDINSKKLVENILFDLAGKVCQTLRDNNFHASTITVKIRYSDFKTITRAQTINHTNDDKIIFETALDIFRNSYTRRVSLRLIGIKLTGFSLSSYQENLFDRNEAARKKLIEAVNSIRNRYGYNSIQMGNY